MEQSRSSLVAEELRKFLRWLEDNYGSEVILNLVEANEETITFYVREYEKQK